VLTVRYRRRRGGRDTLSRAVTVMISKFIRPRGFRDEREFHKRQTEETDNRLATVFTSSTRCGALEKTIN